MKRFCVAVGFVVFLPLVGSQAGNFPPGFVETTYFEGQPGGLTSISWDPAGNLWVGTTLGPVYVHEAGMTRVEFSVPTNVEGEQGIHAIAVDPGFLSNGYVWIYYATGDPSRNRLSRFSKNTGYAEEVVLEGPVAQSVRHNGGCLAIASDGTLYLGMGDDLAGSTFSQDPFDLRGKILHLNADGTAAWDNPYLDGVDGDPRVWALGLRNPYRCNLQPETENLFIGDVGPAAWEELDIGIAGGNFGWAEVEGPEPPGQPGFVYPLYSYPHRVPSGGAVIGGDHVEPGEFNPDYEGDYFFADYGFEEIFRMVLDENNQVQFVETWGTDTQRPTDLKFGPDGAMYYVARSGHSVKRVEYVGGTNRQPVAVATVDPDNGSAPLLVTLSGSDSYDPDADPLNFSWDLGDTSASNLETLQHSYAAGVYEAVLTVDDGDLSDAAPPLHIVSGNHSPTATITQPTEGMTYIAGQQIQYAGTGSDTEEGAIPCGQFTWRVLFHHDNHTHPSLGPLEGDCSGSFTTAERGETSANTWYAVRQLVRDTGVPLGPDGFLEGEDVVEIFPETSFMSFNTTPLPDLDLTLDTRPFTAPSMVEGVVNFIRQIGAVDGQLRAGHTYRWLSWSDGGAKDHEIRTPPVNTTFTATFGCDVIVEVAGLNVTRPLPGDPTLRLSWLPVSDACLSPDVDRYRVYASSTATPLNEPGSFPDDPRFTLIGVSETEEFLFVPAPGDRYFLVVAKGTDLLNGAVGHYGH